MTTPYTLMNAQVIISGDENSIFSLDYILSDDHMIRSDILAYRPDPRDYLKKNVVYDAQLELLDVYFWWNNKKEKIVLAAIINGKKFSKVR